MPAAVLLRLRADGRCRALNRKARDLFAVEHDEDADLHAAIEPSDRARLEAALMEIAGGATRQVPLDLWVRDGTGESRQLSGALSACEDGSRDVIYAGLDVSHISRENRSFRSIVENAAEGIAVHRTGSNGELWCGSELTHNWDQGDLPLTLMNVELDLPQMLPPVHGKTIPQTSTRLPPPLTPK